MPPAPHLHFTYQPRTSLRSRLLAILLALGVSVLIVVMLLRLGALPGFAPKAESRLITFQLQEEGRKKTQAAAKTKQTAAVPPPPIPVPPPPVPVSSPLKMIILSSEEFAAADISKLGSRSGKGQQSADAGEGNGADEGKGEGPNGEKLYNAEWYKKPTDAEMAYYLPAGRPQSGWGMIACRTIAEYRVEDCQELGDSPPGSGLSRALRQAAWQFRVRPPRINGRPLIGAWVRIRFDFTVRAAGEGRESGG